MIAQIIRKLVEVNGLPTKVTATTDRREALTGARYVMNCVRIGGLEAFADDIRIPLEVRRRPVRRRHHLRRRHHVRPARHRRDARLLPRHPRGRRARRAAAQLRQPDGDDDLGGDRARRRPHRRPLPRRAERPPPDRPRPRRAHVEDVDIVCSGINHQTWYLDIRVNGRPVAADELLAAFERHPVFSRQEKVRIDVLRRFGFYSTESNGHLSEYLPWYRKRPDEIMNWIDLSDWIHGETGGYLRYRTENRNWFEEDFPKFLAEAGKPLAEHERTDEHASHILEALETGRTYRGHFNVRNGGTITNLPEDCIIESPGFVDRFGINMVEGVTLPLACAATCSASVSVQRMAVAGRRHRRRHAAEAGRAARPARRRDLHPRRGLADGRRDPRRPGRLAPAVRRRHPRRRRAPEVAQGQDPRLGRAPPARPCAASRSSAPAPAPRRAKATASAPSSWAERRGRFEMTAGGVARAGRQPPPTLVRHRSPRFSSAA